MSEPTARARALEREREGDRTSPRALVALRLRLDFRIMELRSGYSLGLRDASQRPALTEAHLAQLSKGVRLVFARWTALQLAIANQWGGPDSDEKARTLVDKVVTWLQETKEVYADELEDLLDVELLDEWNTQTEDGSVGQVAQCVAKIFYETLRGAGDQVEALERTQSEETRRLGENLDRAHQERLRAEREAELQQREAERERRRAEEAPRVDDDGWETVPSRRR